MNKTYTLIIFLFQALKLFAQEPQFTQFYAAPLYLNPAFAGADVCSRVSNNYRNQWPGIPRGFVSYVLSYDHSLPSLSSGVGVMFTSDKAGSGKLRSTNISGLYAYELQINKQWLARIGVQASYTIRDIDFYNLVFADQIARTGASTSVEIPPGKVSYFDMSSGLLVFSTKYWLGFSTNHLNQPNQSLINGQSILPIKYSLHGGMKIPLRERLGESISPAINFKSQGKFDQLDIGAYYNRFPMVLGVWYRGIPLLKSYKFGYANNDAFAFLLGIEVQRLNIGYSYDVTVSRLISSTSGAHELSLSYQFCDANALKKKKKKAPIIIPCPKF